MKPILFVVICSVILSSSSFAQEYILPLWPDSVPNSIKTDETEISDTTNAIRISYVQQPNISVYLPTKNHATGQAVVICPGGGYVYLSYNWEGTDIAKWLNSKGIATIVLKYRLPNSKSLITRHKAPLQDAQRALRMTRYFAEKWNIDTNKIGIMGFSAGGHLASTLGTHFDYGKNTTDKIEQLSCRPDFQILIYPVISLKEGITHMGSRINLLGENPENILIEYYSNELQVKKDSPPAFMVHSADDRAVPVQNSLLYYEALTKNNIPSELHIYPYGGHGFSLAIGRGYLETWPDRCTDWLKYINK